MKLRLPSNKIILSAIGLLIALAVLLTVVPAAYAESNGPLTPIPGLGRLPNETLVRMHQKEVNWYNDQEDLFKKANSLAEKFQALVTAEAAAQKDVTILQETLTTFQNEIGACREIHNVAGASIFSLAGFGSNGQVKDRLAAGQALIDGRTSLKESHFRLQKAIDDLSKGFAKWRHTRISDYRTPGPTKTP